jgi:hypothetical protein
LFFDLFSHSLQTFVLGDIFGDRFHFFSTFGMGSIKTVVVENVPAERLCFYTLAL